MRVLPVESPGVRARPDGRRPSLQCMRVAPIAVLGALPSDVMFDRPPRRQLGFRSDL